jgi:hypothetical protein
MTTVREVRYALFHMEQDVKIFVRLPSGKLASIEEVDYEDGKVILKTPIMTQEKQ